VFVEIVHLPKEFDSNENKGRGWRTLDLKKRDSWGERILIFDCSNISYVYKIDAL
jgi:hypothetical protein